MELVHFAMAQQRKSKRPRCIALTPAFAKSGYRSAVWRLRFDNTTNWAVVTTGIAISVSFSSSSASPLPLVLVGLLVAFFLLVEARRFRHFEIWRIRAHALGTSTVASKTGTGAVMARRKAGAGPLYLLADSCLNTDNLPARPPRQERVSGWAQKPP